MADRKIEVVISATDDYSAAMRKFNNAVGDMDGAVAKAGASSNRMSSAVAGISAAWVQVGAVVASSAWLIAAATKAYEAEIAFNKLRIQVDALGVSYAGQEAAIDSAIAATSRYAIVQDEDVATVLQQLVFHTGNLTQSMQNLNLVYDLAYMKGVDVATASTLVGKAMAGNIEGLGKFFPELKNVDDLLGKHATTADKAAYAQALFREKVANASSQMTEHELAVKRVHAAYETAHQFIGGVVIKHLDSIVQGVGAVRDVYNELSGVLDSMAAKINPYLAATKKNTDGLMDYEKAKLLVGSAHEKTADQIASAAKKESDAVEAQLERMKKLTVPEGGVSLSAFVLGALKVPEDQFAIVGLEFAHKLTASIQAGFAASPELNPVMAAVTTTDAGLWDEYYIMLAEKYAKETEYANALLDANLAISERQKQIATDERSHKIAMVSSYTGTAANMMQNLYVATGKNNKALFEAGKMLAIAQAVINTAQGATKALAQGGFYGIFMAAAVVAAGMAQIATIKSTRSDSSGGGISADGSANPSYSGGSPGAYPVPTRTEQQAPISVTLIVNTLDGKDVNWARVMEDNILPTMEKISGDGNRPINIRVAQA